MTCPVTKIHPMIVTQVTNAGIRLARIEAVTAHLAQLMGEAHGGDWRIQIEHEVGLILVAKRRDQ